MSSRRRGSPWYRAASFWCPFHTTLPDSLPPSGFLLIWRWWSPGRHHHADPLRPVTLSIGGGHRKPPLRFGHSPPQIFIYHNQYLYGLIKTNKGNGCPLNSDFSDTDACAGFRSYTCHVPQIQWANIMQKGSVFSVHRGVSTSLLHLQFHWSSRLRRRRIPVVPGRNLPWNFAYLRTVGLRPAAVADSIQRFLLLSMTSPANLPAPGRCLGCILDLSGGTACVFVTGQILLASHLRWEHFTPECRVSLVLMARMLNFSRSNPRLRVRLHLVN